MEQIDSHHYRVVQDENVTLTVVSHVITQDIAVSLDGTTVPSDPANPSTYPFQISKSTGAQFLVVNCHFKAADDPNSFYQFTLQGSNGGGPCPASSVRKDDFIKRSTYEFRLPTDKP